MVSQELNLIVVILHSLCCTTHLYNRSNHQSTESHHHHWHISERPDLLGLGELCGWKVGALVDSSGMLAIIDCCSTIHDVVCCAVVWCGVV
jgi:hypothetical protein